VCDKGEEKDMSLITKKINRNSSNISRKVPKLEVVNGKVTINPNDPLQKKWFEEFKK
jgi:hypothetical protein